MKRKTLADRLLEEVGTNDVTGKGATDGGKNQWAPKAGSNDVTDADPNKKKSVGDENPELDLYRPEEEKLANNVNFMAPAESYDRRRAARRPARRRTARRV